ncbi:CGNR zinc finger domain-containing protein [Frigoribacterium sp. 2-23]|uniref:CGNR zinc finger domain-containing protein n=1 Tax=Frigoribacterium sp. 2-23 TaxID=3415006 RepID=UPI003C6FBD05
MATGQWLTSDTDTRWFFDSGSMSLDFAYLGGFRAGSGFGSESGFAAPADGSAGWNGLLVPADLDQWLGERFEGLGGAASDRELGDARGLRDAIARIAVASADAAQPDPDDVDTLNLFAALPDVPPSLDGGRRQAGAGRLRLGQALSSVARDAVRLFDAVGFAGGPDSRLRRCGNELCGLVFHDDSRAGSRRWCSMQRCGNRAKVRAHRARASRA